MKRLLWLAPALATLFIGCSDQDKDGSATRGSNGVNDPFSNIDLDGTNEGNEKEVKDGGTVPLSTEEFDAITNAGCADWTATGEPLPAVLQLVVDVSGSMGQPTQNSDRSKWEITQKALAAAIEELPNETSLGVLYYPNLEGRFILPGPEELWCIGEEEMVPISKLNEDHRERVLLSLGDAIVNSATPTHDAYAYALENSLLESDSSNRYMLLITDGAPTTAEGCEEAEPEEHSPTGPIIDAIASAASTHGVKTFIIGSPGSEASINKDEDMRAWLSAAAEAGQTSADLCSHLGPKFCHLDMTQEPDFGAALKEGLAEVTGNLVSGCSFEVPEPPKDESFDLSLTNLVITSGDGDSTLIIQDENGDCNEGWQLNKTGDIELCKSTCEKVLKDKEAAVLLTFGCDTEEIIPVR